MSILSILSLKGGVGKTTIALNMANEYALQGYKVALVEGDNQQSASDFIAHRQTPVPFEVLKYENKKQLLEIEKDFDIVLIDNSPRVNNILKDILELSSFVLVVSEISIFDFFTNTELAKLLKSYKKKFGLLLSKVEHHQTKEKNEFVKLVEEQGFVVLKQYTKKASDYRKSINQLKFLSEIKSKKQAEIQLIIKEITK